MRAAGGGQAWLSVPAASLTVTPAVASGKLPGAKTSTTIVLLVVSVPSPLATVSDGRLIAHLQSRPRSEPSGGNHLRAGRVA